MRTIEITVSAGEMAQRALVGKYVRVLNAPRPFRMRLDDSPLFDMERGVGFPWDSGFQMIAIESDTDQTIRLAVSPYRVDDQRRESLDDASARGETFDISHIMASSAGNYSYLALHNRPTSNVDLLIDQLTMYGVGTSQSYYYGTSLTDHSDADMTNAAVWGLAFTAAAACSKNPSLSVTSSAYLYAGYDAAVLALMNRGGLMCSNYEQAVKRFAAPYIIPPGYVFVLWSTAQVQALRAAIEYREVER